MYELRRIFGLIKNRVKKAQCTTRVKVSIFCWALFNDKTNFTFDTRLVVFVIVHCLNMHIILHNIGQQLQRLSFSNQLLFKKVVLKIRDAIHYFRVKIGRDYQNLIWIEKCLMFWSGVRWLILQIDYFCQMCVSNIGQQQAYRIFRKKVTNGI